jgi:FkbM family methyltransferase
MSGERKSVRRRLVESVAEAVHEAGFDVIRSPFKHRVVHAMSQRGIRDVLDIGANTGQFAAAMRRAKVAGRIVSVEPLRDAFEQLRSHAAADPSWAVERAAVSATPGTVTINVSANSASSSVLPMLDRHAVAAPASRYVGTEEVEATTVDDLVRRHGLHPETTMLKIDVQGHELAVLEGAADTLPRFGAVRVELTVVPLYEGQALMPELMTHLDAHGLDLWVLEQGFNDPVTRRQLQYDGTFFRRDPQG